MATACHVVQKSTHTKKIGPPGQEWNKERCEIINLAYPIVTYQKYPNGTVVIQRQSSRLQSKRPSTGGTGCVEYLSRRSLSRLAFTVRETAIPLQSLLTLTYGRQPPKDGKLVKKHWNNMRTWLSRRISPFEYVWFLEFQRRGAPHLHVMLSCLPDRKLQPDLARKWARTIEPNNAAEQAKIYRVHNHKLQWQAERKPNGMTRYALSYAMKPYQKQVPKNYQNVGRFWGASYNITRSIPKPETVETAEDEVRTILKLAGHPAAYWPIIPKHLWLNPESENSN